MANKTRNTKTKNTKNTIKLCTHKNYFITIKFKDMMKFFRKKTKIFVVSGLCAILTSQSILINASPVGNYQTNTMATIANMQSNATNNNDQSKLIIPGAAMLAAEAIGAAYAAGYIVGRFAHYLIGGVIDNNGNEANYQSNNFSKFD